MKKVLISLINLYQKVPFLSHYSCRFIPTCSEYAKIAIMEYGAIKGIYLALKRILRCHPGSKPEIDLVPFKEKKWKNLSFYF